MALRFDAFTLDHDRRQLFSGGAVVHLSPKAYDLLTLLVSERPRAVPRTELHDRLWPGTFVTDATLASVVAEVRAALGDTSREPRFIRTAHRFGYAFVAEVSEARPAAPHAPHAAVHWLVWDSREIPLPHGDHVVGRDTGADIALGSASVSRRHARIVVRDDEATLADLGSKNGTFVGGARITAPTRLSDGDALRFGVVRITFRSLAATGTTQTIVR